MLTQEFIAKKRDRQRLGAAELDAFVRGLTDGSVGDAQAAAFAMAVVLNGMAPEETAALTLAMRDSGRRLTWDLPGPVLDKHSTGGVGDKVSLVVAPVLAACGAFVPKLSGPGLGHTGGTLDKLQAIPGYDVHPPLATFQRTVAEAGCAIVGASADVAPADKRLYAIRDVTATVESVPLLTASILSKKLATGVDALVMDVKVGSGAFLPSMDSAQELAASLVDVATAAGLPCRALLTDMNQCLGRAAGNALEIQEAVQLLRGDVVDQRLEEVVVAVAATALVLGGLEPEQGRATERVRNVLASGAAAERFERMVRGFGGPSGFLDAADAHLQAAPVTRPVKSERSGHVFRIDARELGWTVVELGGGRRAVDDGIDHADGLAEVAGHGEPIAVGGPLAVVHARDDAAADRAIERVRSAFVVADDPPPLPGALVTPLDQAMAGGATL